MTAALAQFSELSIFLAGEIVIGLARVDADARAVPLPRAGQRLPRVAGIGVAVYACNPSFLYFDSQFGYESLALTIAAALLLVPCAGPSRSPSTARPCRGWSPRWRCSPRR